MSNNYYNQDSDNAYGGGPNWRKNPHEESSGNYPKGKPHQNSQSSDIAGSGGKRPMPTFYNSKKGGEARTIPSEEPNWSK